MRLTGLKGCESVTAVGLIYYPGEKELELCKRAVWVTMGKVEVPKKPLSSELLKKLLTARHSPIRVLNFGFSITGIPSNIATHLVRHVHAVPFVSTLRNDRQEKIDGDLAPRNTPVDMIFYCNAEELMVIANKRLCNLASQKTREVVQMMCEEVLKRFPEFDGLFVPMCGYHGGVCHEINGCGKCKNGVMDE